MILSIIVISHNQKEQLRRCLDSIMSQHISIEYEVIVSDDASTDGTFELAQEYATQYEEVCAYQCDTNSMNPSNNSFRSGLNRCNALQYAKGKYVAHMDGDDFLIPHSNIYQKQVELLEQHPECACCMANDYSLLDGDDIEKKSIRHENIFETNYVLKSEDYIANYFRESHCFVYRRNIEHRPIDILGGYYVDNALTAFYCQFGDIVCLKDAGYVYVQYAKSVWNGYSANDRAVIGCPAIYNAILMPKWKPIYWQSAFGIALMKKVVRLALHAERVADETKKWMNGLPDKGGFVFSSINSPLSLRGKSHLAILDMLLGLMKRAKRKHPAWPMPWRLLDKLMYN